MLPADPRELFSAIHVVSLPMHTRFRGITTREAMLLHGPAGWAEFSPFVEYPVTEAVGWLAAAVEFAGSTTPAGTGDMPSRIPVNATVPACPAADVPRVLAGYGEVTTVKIKIAEHGIESLPEDLARIAAVARELPDAALRLDANAAYTVPQALTACRALAGFELQYLEQPVAGVEDLARVREALAAEGLGVRLAADESIRKAEDPLRVAALGAADVIVVKVQPLGGIGRALQVVNDCGLPAVVSSALETSVGLAAGAQLAAALPVTPASREILGERPACGLGTSALFCQDVTRPALRPVSGTIPVGRVAPDPDLLERHAAAPERRTWWLERLHACWQVLRGA